MQAKVGSAMRWKSAARYIAKGALFVVLSLAFAVALFHFMFQPFQVAGLSMSPSLADRDYLLVDRVFFRSTGIRRGDLVVFKIEGDPRYMVKRVVGLPGEEISSHDGLVAVNGKLLSPTTWGGPQYPDFGPVQIPLDAYFCMGDNPKVSLDSRTFGPIKKGQIYGKPLLRYLPISRSGFLTSREAAP